MNARLNWAILSGALVLASTLVSIARAQPRAEPDPKSTGAALQGSKLLAKFGNRGVALHDPSTIVKCKDEFWAFATGRNLPSYHSSDLSHWVAGPPAIANPPGWIAQAVPRNVGNRFWAPDVIKVGDRYFLFYAVSTFGANTSAIGIATNPTLDPADPQYRWTDGGIVVQSTTADKFNAIDPAPFLDNDGRLWLAFGSFWSGIKLIELDPLTGRRIAPDSPMHSLAFSKTIEAPYLYRHDARYYLFVNFGLCCRGVNSTYYIVVGRAERVVGPYFDKNGKDMLTGGGTTIADTQEAFIGPGQVGILEDQGKLWLSCHFYDGTTPRGISRLSIRPLTWSDDGWPIVGQLDDSK